MVAGYNLGIKAGYSDRGFSEFPQSSEANAGILP